MQERPASLMIPSWIESDAAWRAVRPSTRWVLYVLCRACRWTIDPAGSIGYATIPNLMAEIGLKRAAVWRHLYALHAAGFVVKVSQGGYTHDGPFDWQVDPGSRSASGRNVANAWAVPGRRGALDTVAIAWEARGRVKPTALGAGQVPTADT